MSAKSLRINEPVIHRGRCDVSSDSAFAGQHFSEMYTDVITNVVSSLLERYDTDSLQLLKNFEMTLEEDSACSEDFITTNCPDVDTRRFLQENNQLMLYKVHKKIPPRLNIDGIANLFITDKSLIHLFPNIAILICLYLTLPCTSCEAERSFSCLRRIKTYLRTTMTQNRLSNEAILNVHSSLTSLLHNEMKEFYFTNQR